MLSIRVPVFASLSLAAVSLLAACSREVPAPAQPAPTAAAVDAASSPLPGVIGQPSDVTASKTTKSPADPSTAVGGLTAHPENGSAATGGVPAPTGGDAAPGHAASSASQ